VKQAVSPTLPIARNHYSCGRTFDVDAIIELDRKDHASVGIVLVSAAARIRVGQRSATAGATTSAAPLTCADVVVVSMAVPWCRSPASARRCGCRRTRA